MNNEQNIFDKEFDDLVKRSLLIEPTSGMEDRVMQKIHAAGSRDSVKSRFSKWLPFIIYAIFASIFAFLLLMPVSSQNSLKINTTFNLNRFQIVDPEIFNLGPSQPYLLMSIFVFAIAVWLIILFNLPKKDSFRRTF